MNEAPRLKQTDRKKADILSAAIDEFKEVGFAGARINRIAERAAVSKRTLYKHYPSKEALFEAIIEKIVAEHQAASAPSYQADRDLSLQLQESLAAYFRVTTSDTYMTLARILVSEFLRSQAITEEVLSRFEVHHQSLKNLVASAIEAGQIRDSDPEYATTQLIALVKAFLFWPKFLMGQPLPPQKRIAEIIEDATKMWLTHYQA